MYETILLATDGSDASTSALDHALALAEATGATLHALYVVDTGHPYGGFDQGTVSVDPVVAGLRREGEQTLQTVADRADTVDVPCVTAQREGDSVHAAIDDYRAEVRADLVVVGTHGRSGLDRLLLGSVAERVVRTATVPVLVVHTEPQ